jgi:hypothetical protein
LFPTTAGAKYAGTLIRGIPRFPADPDTFNAKAPLPVQRITPSPELISTEQDWAIYRSFINQTRNAAITRSTTYAGLSFSAISSRKSYAKQAISDDEASMDIRHYFHFREIGWSEFQANKYKGLQDEAVKNYADGVRAIIKAYQDNTAGKSDYDPNHDMVVATDAQMASFKKFMSTSLLSKQLVADQYDKDMTEWGRVCDVLPLECSTLISRLTPRGDAPVQWAFNKGQSKKYTNTLELGYFSLQQQPVDLESLIGVLPEGHYCKTNDAPTNPARNGPQLFTVSVKNLTTKPENLSIAYAGSWTRAYWEESPGASTSLTSYIATLGPGETRTIKIDFRPMAGYEDLNDVLLMQDGRLVSELLLDYQLSDDSILRLVEMGSLDVLSGDQKWYDDYTIEVPEAPPFYVVRKSCLWLSGDRVKCENFSRCSFSQSTGSSVIASFGLQGHEEKENPGRTRRESQGHLKAAYQLTGPPTGLK